MLCSVQGDEPDGNAGSVITNHEGGMDMDIGIIGSGHIGSILARHLAALGHRVSIANSRGPASLAALAADTGATAATVEQAARGSKQRWLRLTPHKSLPTASKQMRLRARTSPET